MKKPCLIALAFTALAAPAAAEDHVVSQKGKQFDPGVLRVKVGDRVLFENDDEITHNVFSRTAGNAFNVGMQQPGSSSPVTFQEAGTVDVRCAIHPGMKLTIEVEK
jgi:plastocyanin